VILRNDLSQPDIFRVDNPASRHLHFVSVRRGKDVPGFAKGLTKEGKETIRLCGLNERDLLVTLRELEQKNAVRDYLVQLSQTDYSEEAVERTLEAVCKQSAQYAAARRDAVLDLIHTSARVVEKTA
jgi:hypothetical protein